MGVELGSLTRPRLLENTTIRKRNKKKRLKLYAKMKGKLIFCLLLQLFLLKEAQLTGRPEDCGLPDWKRVVDHGFTAGPPVQVKKHPWAVSFVDIRGRDSSGNVKRDIYCTGSIVSSNTILTAAHCIDDEERNHGTELVMGTSTPEDLVDPSRITRTIHKHWIHDDYQNDEAYFDAGVVEMNEAIDFTDFNKDRLYPICIPLTASKSIDRFVDRTGTVIGFGIDWDQGRSESVLTQAQGLVILSASECNELHPSSAIADSFRVKSVPHGFQDLVCAMNPLDRNTGIVLGDSGGPFMMYKSGKFQQLGIVHGKAGTAQEYPDVFVFIGKPDIFDFVIKRAFGSGSAVDCLTITTAGGQSAGVSCVLPFIYNGKEYRGCTLANVDQA